MTENKRFELQVNVQGKADIIDWVESKEKNAICIYNDLGVLPFSSAKAVCDKLNEQDKRIKELEEMEDYFERKKCEYHNKWNLTHLDNINLRKENEQLRKEKEFWKGDSCNCSNYLSILSMDCQIVQEAIYDLRNVIDVDTEAFRLLDKLDDKFDELNQHRIKMYSR